MTTVFNDTFTAGSDTTLASHTPDTGTSWSVLWQDGTNPTLVVIAATDRAKGVTANNSGVIYTANATYPSADYEVQWTIVATPNISTRPCYVFVRLADQENGYAVRYYDGAGGCQLYKKVAGTWSTLGSAVTVAVGSVCKLQISGSTLKLFDDGVEVASVSDSSLSAAGKAGFGYGGGAELTASTDDANSIVEIDNFSVTDLGSGGGNHALTATGVDTGSPTVGSPAITQAHGLAGTGAATGTPATATPALTQVHGLSGTGVDSGTPEGGSPSLTQAHSLIADGVDTGTPTVGAPALSAAGNDALEADGVSAGTPTAGVPDLMQVHVLAGTGIGAGVPGTGVPALTQGHVLTPAELVGGVPLTGTPAVGQAHVLAAVGTGAGTVVVGMPVLWLGELPPPAVVMVVEGESRRVVVEGEVRVVGVAGESRIVSVGG